MPSKRRDKGTGALFKRADGYWVGQVEMPSGPDGERRRKRVVRKNRNDCIAALREIQKAADAGTLTNSTTLTVEKWLNYWVTDILPHRGVKPGTVMSYTGVVKRDLIPNLGAMRLDKLHPSDIRNLYVKLTEKKSGRVAQKADQVLRLAIKAAVRDDIIGANLMDRVDKPGHTQKTATAFSADVSKHIIQTAVATQGIVWGARWATGFTTGARESEVLGLEWDHVDLDKAQVDISWQLLRLQKTHGCGPAVDGKYPCGMVKSAFCPGASWKFPAGMDWRECVGTLVWTQPKTKAGNRIIPLVPEMVKVLRVLRERDGHNPHGLVFHHEDGSPFSQDQDQKMWRKLLVAAEVPHAPQHSIRHSTATLLMDAGVDVHVVQSVIGHTDIAVTRMYQHVSLELARKAWGNLGAVMPAQ